MSDPMGEGIKRKQILKMREDKFLGNSDLIRILKEEAEDASALRLIVESFKESETLHKLRIVELEGQVARLEVVQMPSYFLSLFGTILTGVAGGMIISKEVELLGAVFLVMGLAMSAIIPFMSRRRQKSK